MHRHRHRHRVEARNGAFSLDLMGNTMITCCSIRPKTVRVYRDKGLTLDFPFRLPASRIMRDYPNHLLVYRSVRRCQLQNPRESPGTLNRKVLSQNIDIKVVRWGQTLEPGHDYFLVNIPDQYRARFAKYFNPKSSARYPQYSPGTIWSPRFSPGGHSSPRFSPGPQFSPRFSPGSANSSIRFSLRSNSRGNSVCPAVSSPKPQDIQRKHPWKRSPNSRNPKSRLRRWVRSPAHKSPISKGQGRSAGGEGSDATLSRASDSGQFEHRSFAVISSDHGKVVMSSVLRGFRRRRCSRRVWKPVLESISEVGD